MPEITAEQVRNVRALTGAGLFDCKQSLIESDGDVEKALVWIRKKTGQRPTRTRQATEGIIESYIHLTGGLGVLLEVNCETDFAARSEPFKTLVHDLVLQIAASNPTYVRREEVDFDHFTREQDILKAQLKAQGKPEKLWEMIITGKTDKFYQEVCLLDQPFVKDPDKTVWQVVREVEAVIGETISVRRFTRYVLGEGMVKEHKNFAAEVAAAAGIKIDGRTGDARLAAEGKS